MEYHQKNQKTCEDLKENLKQLQLQLAALSIILAGLCFLAAWFLGWTYGGAAIIIGIVLGVFLYWIGGNEKIRKNTSDNKCDKDSEK